MNNQFEENKNTKAICIPNGSFYEPIYIKLEQNAEKKIFTLQDQTDAISDSLHTRNDSKSVILNSSTEDENTAIEALRQLGNISICTKSQQESPLLTCLSCNAQIEVADLESHALVCKQFHVKCYNCFLNFDFREYREHVPCSENFTKCKICSVVFDGILDLNTHMKLHHSSTIEGLYCSTKSDDDFIDHCDKNTFPVLNSIWDEYEIIDENFTDVAQEMVIHTTKADESFQDISSLEPSENTSAILLNNKTNVCKQCNKSFKREKAFLSHMKLHSSFLEISCTNCEKSFVDEESLVKHREQCNNFKNSDAWSVRKISIQKYTCSNCQKAFSTKQKLHRHMWVHRKKAFTCETCAACFEKQVELDTHRLTMHQSTTGYSCNECGKCFSSRQGLWEHNRIHGSTNHQYKCDECLKAFSSRQGYLIHKRAHNDERPYGCHFCWKTFRDGGTLRKHERIHTGVRPHICPLCSKAFNQKVVLREHVRWIHISNWEPNKHGDFECSLCDVVVTEKDDLCAHIVKHSDNMSITTKNKLANDEKAVQFRNSGISNVNTDHENVSHKCDLCEEEFLDRMQLARHVQMHI